MDRRNFLKAGALGAAMTIASTVSFPAYGKPGRRKGKSGKLKLSFEPYELKLRHAFNLAKSQRTTTPDVQVKIEYDGITGYGEASMPPYLGESVASAVAFLSRLDLGKFNDPFMIEEIHDYMDSVAPDNRAAKASVDIALHDLLGKIMGQPWYKIWGLDPRKTPDTSFTVSYDADPDELDAKIDEASPYKVIKIKMGLDHDKELVEAIRRKSDAPICVDVNQGWTDKEQAL